MPSASGTQEDLILTDSLAVNHRIYIQFVGLDLSQAAASRPTEYEALIGQGDRSTQSVAKKAGVVWPHMRV